MTWTKEQKNTYSRDWAKRNKARRALYARKWKAKNPEKAAALAQKYREKYGPAYYAKAMQKARNKNPRKAKNTALRNTVGITVDDYERMFTSQGGVCACCGEPEWRTAARAPNKGKVLALCVDHDHDTGKVRDLLCGSCNSAVGMIRERVWVAERIGGYLKKWGK